MNQKQRDFILSLDRDGSITPDAVLEAAIPEDSPIHDCFTWENDKAGHKYRLDEARTLIRRVRVHYIPGDPRVYQIRINEYIRDPEKERREQGYVRSAFLRTREASARSALDAELRRVEGMVSRTRQIAAVLGLVAECEAGLSAIFAGTTEAEKVG